MYSEHIVAQWLGRVTLHKIASIHQIIIMLATSENGLFPGHDYLVTTGTDDPSL